MNQTGLLGLKFNDNVLLLFAARSVLGCDIKGIAAQNRSNQRLKLPPLLRYTVRGTQAGPVAEILVAAGEKAEYVPHKHLLHSPFGQSVRLRSGFRFRAVDALVAGLITGGAGRFNSGARQRPVVMVLKRRTDIIHQLVALQQYAHAYAMFAKGFLRASGSCASTVMGMSGTTLPSRRSRIHLPRRMAWLYHCHPPPARWCVRILARIPRHGD